MFEFWITGLSDGLSDDTFSHNGTTHDFLQVLCDISKLLGPTIAGDFVAVVLAQQESKIEFLRVTEWNCTYKTKPFEDRPETVIRIHRRQF